MMPGLDQVLLEQCDHEDIRHKVDGFVGASEREWPRDILHGIQFAEKEWRQRIGKIVEFGRTTACVHYDGNWWCIVRIHFLRIADPALKSEGDGAGPGVSSPAGAGAELARRVGMVMTMQRDNRHAMQRLNLARVVGFNAWLEQEHG